MRIIEISIHFIRGYPLSYPLRIHGGFYPQISAGMDIVVIPIPIPFLKIHIDELKFEFQLRELSLFSYSYFIIGKTYSKFYLARRNVILMMKSVCRS